MSKRVVVADNNQQQAYLFLVTTAMACGVGWPHDASRQQQTTINNKHTFYGVWRPRPADSVRERMRERSVSKRSVASRRGVLDQWPHDVASSDSLTTTTDNNQQQAYLFFCYNGVWRLVLLTA